MEKEKKTPYSTPGTVNRARPIFCGRAVFADESEYYRMPPQADPGDPVKVRIRTLADNVDEVWLRLSGNSDAVKYKRMNIVFQKGGFDYFEASFMAGSGPTEYDFELRRDGRIWRYSRMGLTLNGEWYYPFRFCPGYYVPDWVQGAVMYQIFTDRFCNGDPENDVEDDEFTYIGRKSVRVKDWNALPEAFDVHRFYGGDLAGILQKLDYLKDLGVEALYLNPIFTAPSNHKYDTQDYFHVDPHFGKIVKDAENRASGDGKEKYRTRTTDPENTAASDALLQKLIEEAHRRGIRVILDGVFNHCGSFNKWFDEEGIYEGIPGENKGAFRHFDSPYRSYFRFSDPFGWPENHSCNYWWGNSTLPKLAHEDSRELREEILSVAEKWISPPYNADGWRLDVAADLGYDSDFNHRFWQIFRNRVKKANPEAVIIAEHYGDASVYLKGGEWDTVMNYDAFMDPVSYFLTGMEKHSDRSSPELEGDGYAFFEAMQMRMCQFGTPSLLAAMNELDNHDHSRFLTRTNRKVGRITTLGSEAAGEDISYPVMRIAIVLQMLWSGAPTLYYGDEAGTVGFTDPDNRRTYPWGHENKELLDFYKRAIALHKKYKALRRGSLKMIDSGEDYICFGRFTDSEKIVCVVNTSEKKRHGVLPVWETGFSREADGNMRRIFRTTRDGFDEEETEVPLIAGMLHVVMEPQEASVFIY